MKFVSFVGDLSFQTTNDPIVLIPSSINSFKKRSNHNCGQPEKISTSQRTGVVPLRTC